MICNKKVDLIVKLSQEKTYFYNNVLGYSITEGKIHFKNPANGKLLHYPETWVGIVEVEQ
jgi:hypothetical protein